jgi:type IV pilus assembly protein PilA
MNRAQQAYYLEYNEFSKSIENLGLGIEAETENYTYYTRPSTVNTPPPVSRRDNKSGHWLFKHEKNQSSSSLSSHQVVNYAISRRDNLRSYVGFVFDTIPREMIEVTTFAILCQADNPGTISPAIPNYKTGQLACAPGTSDVLRNY